jgi:hypothetical protein
MNVVPVPAPVRNTRIHVANVSPAPLTVVQEPTRVEGGIAVAVEGTNIPLECTCPGGRRSFTLETLKLGFVIDVDSRSGGVIAQATIEGDAGG